MKKAIFVAVSMLAMLPAIAFAKGEDLKNCRFSDGGYIVQPLCDRLRQDAIAERKHRAEQEETLRRQQAEQDERRRQRDEEAAELRRQWELAEQERQKKQAEMQAKSDAEYVRYEQEEARREKLAAERTRATKQRCGDDYRAPRIGMSLARAQDCAGPFKLKGQINRADGVISTYVRSGMYIHVMDSRIVSWGTH